MKPVAIVGAGFSGLTLAHYLKLGGVPCEIFEREANSGGLIQTHHTEHGLVETAANGLLRNEQVDALFKELGLHVAKRQDTIRKRYVFWLKPKRWPLSPKQTFKLITFLLKKKLVKVDPLPDETVKAWAIRNIGSEFEARLLGPALQGIYAGDTGRLSAKLVLNSWLSGTRKSGGSVAPEKGMGELLAALSQEATIHYGQEFKLQADQPTVICTSAWAAAEILKTDDPETSARLARVEALPLTTATLFFKPQPQDVQGFGCLFPANQGFSTLGVLFNECIFAKRSDVRSETWITRETDEEIQKHILRDRQRLTGRSDSPLSVHIKRWVRAIPYYTTEWEKELSLLKPKEFIHLHGNYQGQLGLAQILKRSSELAQELKVKYGD